MWTLISLFLLVSTQISSQLIRPFWNIAHMVNDLNDIERFLNEGANAVETDITFNTNDGTAEFSYHGFPCDCWRYCFDSSLLSQYLLRVKKLTSPDDPEYKANFVLLMLDCKISVLSNEIIIKAGENLANNLLLYLWDSGNSTSKVWIVISIPHSKYIHFIKSFRETLITKGFSHLLAKVGWDIAGNEEPEIIEDALRKIDVYDSIWLSYGMSNCFVTLSLLLSDTVLNNLNSLIERRNLPNSNVSKAYFWTVDMKENMRQVFRFGIDAIISNKNKRIVEVLNEDEFIQNFRLADISDNPWIKIPSSS